MKRSLIIVLALCAAACGPRGSSGSGNNEPQKEVAPEFGCMQIPAEAPVPAPSRSFPNLSVPKIYGENTAEAQEYVLEHYWDNFLEGDGITGPQTILGVSDDEVDQAVSNYVEILSIVKSEATPEDLAPLHRAQGSIRNFFKNLEKKQLADTSALTYLRLTELVSHYLYDPISPARDEDLYLPFVEAMEKSPCTRDDMRNAYRHELKMCRTNTFGQAVPDFRFSDIKAHKNTLYGVKADYTMLFFSNPGCESCKEIIHDVMSRRYIESYISEGKLAIVNIYIDEEVDKWRDYSPNYPKSWINGYDYTFSLRDSGKYDIRAIPSLYLLDSHKRVLMKDAPTERVLSFLDTI